MIEVTERVLVVDLSVPETADLLGSSPQPSLGFTENGPRKGRNPADDVRGEWTDRLEIIDRQQKLNQGLQNTISEHTTPPVYVAWNSDN